MTKTCWIAVAATLLAAGCTVLDDESARSTDDELRFTETHLTTPDGVRLYVRVTGSGPDTVIVPAAAWLARDFGPLTRGRTLIFYDPRSRGGSDAADSTRLGIEHDLHDLELVRAHFGVETVSVIGWSYYGAVVALYAAEHPDRVERAVQIGPMAPSPDLARVEEVRGSPPDSADRAFVQALVDSGRPARDPVGYCREAVMRMLIRPMMGRPDSARRARVDPCTYWNEWPDQMRRTLGHVLPTEWDFTDEGRRVSVPVLTVHGTDDPNAPVEGGRAWAELIPQGRLLELEGVGHAPWLEAPDRFFTEVDAFLRGG